MKSSGQARVAIGLVGLVVSIAFKVFLVVHRTKSNTTEPTPIVARAPQPEQTNQAPPPAQVPPAPASVAPRVVSPAPAPVLTPVVPPAALEPKPPRTFPVVKLQGIAYRKEKPAALINGKTLFVGDHLGEAKIVAIDPSSATLEIEGEFRVYVLGK